MRLIGIIVITLAVLGAGFETGFGVEESPESTVQAFLLNWQQRHYTDAAAYTTGAPAQVAKQLSSIYTNLDASATFISLGQITQHGGTAAASYQSTVYLAQGQEKWTYTGHFGLTQRDGDWRIDWAPSVVNPSLGAGDRLAIVTSYPERAAIQDQSGQPLVPKTLDYHIGVYPGRLKNPGATARKFSDVTGLDASQVAGMISAAPPRDFLPLLTLEPKSFGSVWPRLSAVPGMTFQHKTERLFPAAASDVIGEVGTEASSTLRDAGAAYQPGNTVGLSGLEQAYQDELVGVPTTSVVVIGHSGATTRTLWTSQGGHPGTPVRTTLRGSDQSAAETALAAQGGSGEIVAVDATSGDILAIAARDDGTAALPEGGPLNARIAPGMAFSIVSAAAMIGDGVQPDTPLPCYSSEAVGGQTFTYSGQQQPATFASDFANGCGTAFASMSTKLTPADLASAEKSFGIGANWDLLLQAFSGSAQSASAGASLAAQAIGTSGVRVSPLGMALIAAEVDSGAGHGPRLTAGESAQARQAPLSGSQLDELRQLMRQAVRSGSARAANLSGKNPVYGQAGVVQTGPGAWLSWFVGYRGTTAVAVLDAGSSPQQAAASLAGSFLSKAG